MEQSRRLLEESEGWLRGLAEKEKAKKEEKEKVAGLEGEEAKEQEEDDEEEEEEDRRPPPSTVIPTQRVLTEGAGLSLRRTLKGLEELMKRGPNLAAE